jgi:ELMO/CED-12 family
MAQKHPSVFDDLLHKRTGERAATEYPFCAAGAFLNTPQCCVMACKCMRNNMCAFVNSARSSPHGPLVSLLLLRLNRRTFCWRAGINITFQLEQLLELRTPTGAASNAAPRSPAGTGFVHLLDSNSNAFQELYVATFVMLDKLWLERRASYMDFPVVLSTTMQTVRQALHRRPSSVRDVWAYLGLNLDTS